MSREESCETRGAMHVYSRDRIGITDTGKITVFLGYYSITFDETEMVRIPVRCCQNDVGSINVFRCNTAIIPINKILIY